MAVPNIFANATASIPLSQLDTNFATTITLGNTAIQLGNTVTTLNNMTLANVTVSSGNATVTNANVTTLTATNDASISGLTVGKGGGAVANNTAIGASSLNATNTGTGLNTAVGAFSLYTNTSGSESVAIGYEALRLNTTGLYNVAVGQGCLRSNTTAQENTSVGNNSMKTNTTGASNSALGAGALFANTTGSSNTGLGYNALAANTTASNNTAVGYQAGYTATTNISNCFIGAKAGYAATGANNTYVGAYNSGGNGSGSAMTSGNSNTILGGYTGNQGGLDIRTASNRIVLSDGDGNPWVVVNNGGSMVLGGNGYSYDASPYQDTEGFIVGLNDGTRYGAIFGCNNVANREAVVFVNPNGAVGNIRTNGSNTAFNTSSDYRLKNTISPMTGALAKVAQLKPCTYKWNVDGSDGEGFIAHELAEVCPYAVSGDKDAVDENGKIKPQGIDVSFLVATLTAAIQELKAEFDAYKATHP